MTRLKEQPGQDILMYGFGPLAYTLLDNGLLDEARFWIHPLLLGAEHRAGQAGDVLLRKGSTVALDLVDSTVLKSGVVIVSYRPAAK